MSSRLWRFMAVAGGVVLAGAGIVLTALFAYRLGLVVGLLIGFVSAVWFLAAHRPHLWWRAEALAAMGMPTAMALLCGRSLVLVLVTWPGTQPRTTGQAVFSLITLALVDAVLVAKVISFRRFVRRDRLGIPQPGMPIPAEMVDRMRTRIRDLEEDREKTRQREIGYLARIERLRAGRPEGPAGA